MILRFNESQTFLIGKEIINNLEDICTNLKDDFINYHLEPDNDIKIKFLGIYLEGGIKRTKFELEIQEVNKLKGNQIDSMISTLKYIENYIISEGITFSYELYYSKSFPNKIGRVGSVTYKKATHHSPANLIKSKSLSKEMLTIPYKKEVNNCKTILIKFNKK
jgi:hypothetical protein